MLFTTIEHSIQIDFTFSIYRVRGRLGSTLMFGCNIGILIAYILGTYLSYSTVPIVLLIITVLFMCGAIVIPDSPLYLMKKSQFEVGFNLILISQINFNSIYLKRKLKNR